MFNGKALYNPGGKAGEYGRWAINFYNGCSNNCSYCYLRKGVYAPLMGTGKPELKKCFSSVKVVEDTPGIRALMSDDKAKALYAAITEIKQNREAIIRDGGVFFSFSTDPCLDETIDLTLTTALYCVTDNIPVMILTKMTDWIYSEDARVKALFNTAKSHLRTLAIGFTLTGHDEIEPGAASNDERISAMRYLKENGVITFASIEPIIDFKSSLEMVKRSVKYCDHFKLGLLSGGKKPQLIEVISFINEVRKLVIDTKKTVYWKQSIRDIIGGGSPVGYNFVEADWNIFTGNLDKRTF